VARDGAHFWRRARTAATLPGRLVAVEDRIAIIDAHVVAKLDEMRAELAEIRTLLHSQLVADEDATALVGRLLQELRGRVDALESAVAPRRDEQVSKSN